MKFKKVFLTLMVASGIYGGLIAAQINIYDTVKPEYYDIFFNKKDRVYLTGMWNIISGGRGKILVPNLVDARGDNSILNFADKEKNPNVRWTLGKDFNINKKNNKRYILKFEGVSWNPEFTINNGKTVVLENLSPGWASEYFNVDITDMLKNGENNIKVSFDVVKRQMRLFSSGIYNPVFIDIVDPIYADELLITTALPNKFTAKAKIINTMGKKVERAIQVVIKPWDKKGNITKIDFGKKVLEVGENNLTLEGEIKDCQIWDIDNPFLYSFLLKSDKILIGHERFGVREFKVEGNEFVLNGRKLKCYGIAGEEGHLPRVTYTEGLNLQFSNNSNNLLRKYLKGLKEANVNSLIRYPKFTKILLNLMDEVGILGFHTYQPWKMYYGELPKGLEKKLLKDTSLVDSYSRGFFYKDKKIMPESNWNIPARNQYLKDIFRKLGVVVRNNPSVVAILPGDENFREPNQAFDLPIQREGLYESAPNLVFAAEHGIGNTSNTFSNKFIKIEPHAQQDFENFAGLACGGAAGSYVHYTMFPQTLKWCAENWVLNDYGKMIPIFADEALWYGETRTLINPGLWRRTVSSFNKMNYGDNLNKKEMLRIFGRTKILDVYDSSNFRERSAKIRKTKDYYGVWWPFFKTIKCIGLQANYLDRNVIMETVAEISKRNIEMVRIYDQYMQGVGNVTGPFMIYDSAKIERSEIDGIGKLSPIGKVFQATYAPVFVCLNFYEKYSNAIAGATLDLKVYGFNNSQQKFSNVSVKITLAGKTITKKLDLTDKVKDSIDIKIEIPKDLTSNFYDIDVKMFDGKKEIAKNNYYIFVMSERDLKLSENKKEILVLGKNDSQFAKLLEQWGVNAKYVDNVPKYQENQRLIVAPKMLKKENIELEKYLTSGGKVLVLEQDANKSPKINEHSIISLDCRAIHIIGTPIGLDLMTVENKHKAFDKINNRKNWHTLNNSRGEVYRSLIGPLDENALAIGADVGPGEVSRVFGALLLEKDNLLWSQVEAVRAASNGDAVATKYLQNLIEYLQK